MTHAQALIGPNPYRSPGQYGPERARLVRLMHSRHSHMHLMYIARCEGDGPHANSMGVKPVSYTHLTLPTTPYV